MRNTYDGIHVFQRPDHKFICQNAGSVIEAKETVVRENGPNAHEMRVKDAFVAKRGKTGMGMN